jgi:hypothetical protein
MKPAWNKGLISNQRYNKILEKVTMKLLLQCYKTMVVRSLLFLL